MKSEGCEIQIRRNSFSLTSEILAIINERNFLNWFSEGITKMVVDKVSTEIAKIIVTQHGTELVNSVDMHTISCQVNNVLAERMTKALTTEEKK